VKGEGTVEWTTEKEKGIVTEVRNGSVGVHR